MSSVASVEFAHSPEELAGLIDRELADVASHLPDYVMTSPLGAGTVHELHRVEGVGALHAMYLGFLAGPHKLGPLFDEQNPHDRYSGIRVVAEAERGQTAFWQDYALDYWHRAKVIESSAAEDVIQAQLHFPELSVVVQSLHHAYMDRVHTDPNIINLARHVRSRASASGVTLTI